MCLKCQRPFQVDFKGDCVFCDKGEFFDEETKTCRKCHSSCASCSKDNTCDECAADFAKTATTDNALCYNCQPHQKLTANGCKSCGSACKECSQATLEHPAFCQTCATNSVAFGNEIKESPQCFCIEGFGLRTGGPNVADACAPCAVNCLRC